MKALMLSAVLLFATAVIAAEPTVPAASAINSFGLDVLRKTASPNANALLSPYSIETALAMTYAGADGVTREEMQSTLHFSTNEMEMHRSFATLQKWLEGTAERSQEEAGKHLNRATNDPITLTVANRLFAQKGYEFKQPFLDFVDKNYGAPLEQLDFKRDPVGAAKFMNDWADMQTKHRIRNIIPDGAISDKTRLVLANAIYLKAPWEENFCEGCTKPSPFHVAGAATADVPTMLIETQLGYAKYSDFTAVTVPYKGGELQFLILLPDANDGLTGLESKLKHLEKCAMLPTRNVILHLPKFKIQPPTLPLKETLRSLGMKTAFDDNTANFTRMSDESLLLSAVFHKTFLSLDEKGTEAAAATFVDVVKGLSIPEPPKNLVEVRVDHPFVFAIQHRASGACLFLGHVTDPR